MGRTKKYTTKEQQDNARKERQMKYYWKNRDDINDKNKERYHDKINGISHITSSLSQPFTLSKL
jgi:hypothetical protein